jgi:LmbE family N-acetylglucosaminyl deacetylase
VSPHPDDATLAAAGLIQRVRRVGGAVHVVQMTSGDAFFKGVVARRQAVVPTADDYREYGATRERETLAAMRTLGVKPSHVTLLGFPDDGLCKLASPQDARDPYQSPYTRRNSPPAADQVIRGVTYRGEDLRRELGRVIAEFKPTIVLMPHPRDEHPDHCATHLFVHEALDAIAGELPARPLILHFVIHFGAWPMSAPGGELAPPPTFPASDGVWQAFALSPAEGVVKKRALAAYRTQLLVLNDLVAAFARTDEIFIEGEPPAPPACWCRGENILAR